jgi:hypothetical protein
MLAPSIVTRPAPPTAGGAQATFEPSRFENLILQQGGRVYHERALRCPCAAREAGNSQLTACKNCGGFGWVFINKTETRMVLQHQNLKVSYEAGSERVLGDSSVSTLAKDRLTRMDRITEPDAESTHNQLLQFRYINDDGRWFCYTDYPIKSALSAFLYQSSHTPLLPLVEGTDYTLGDQRIILSEEFDTLTEVTVTLTYVHMPQYYVVELTRGTITVNARGGTEGKKSAVKMPLNALVRKAEFVLDQNSYSGQKLFDNSTLTSCTLEK